MSTHTGNQRRADRAAQPPAGYRLVYVHELQHVDRSLTRASWNHLHDAHHPDHYVVIRRRWVSSDHMLPQDAVAEAWQHYARHGRNSAGH